MWNVTDEISVNITNGHFRWRYPGNRRPYREWIQTSVSAAKMCQCKPQQERNCDTGNEYKPGLAIYNGGSCPQCKAGHYFSNVEYDADNYQWSYNDNGRMVNVTGTLEWGNQDHLKRTSTCNKCPTGYVSNGWEWAPCTRCDFGQYVNADKTLCIECNGESICTSGTEACTGCQACKRGFGGSGCYQCLSGKWSRDNMTCSTADTGKYTVTTQYQHHDFGIVNVGTDNVDCPRGFYQNEEDKFGCKDCDWRNNLYSDSGQSGCIGCDAGRYIKKREYILKRDENLACSAWSCSNDDVNATSWYNWPPDTDNECDASLRMECIVKQQIPQFPYEIPVYDHVITECPVCPRGRLCQLLKYVMPWKD
jgi:hypothetical protein